MNGSKNFIIIDNLMQKRVFIIHGWEGYPEEAWFPWLKKELETRGFEVFVPSMPDSGNPKIEVWVPFLKNLVGKCDKIRILSATVWVVER